MKNYHALLLPPSSGFKQLSDRMLYDDGVALVFESREDAQRYLDRNQTNLYGYGGLQVTPETQVAIEPVSLSLVSDPSATSSVARLDSLEATIMRAEDGKLVVEIDGPSDDARLRPDGSPDIRVWLNDALIYRDGQTGDNLNDDG